VACFGTNRSPGACQSRADVRVRSGPASLSLPGIWSAGTPGVRGPWHSSATFASAAVAAITVASPARRAEE
jgi:hypothetical protein